MGDRRQFELFCNGSSFKISKMALMDRSDLFNSQPDLLSRPYSVKSQASPEVMSDFVRLVQGDQVEFTLQNAGALKSLADEFEIGDLAGEIGGWIQAHSQQPGGGGARGPRDDLKQWKEIIESRIQYLEADNSFLRNQLASATTNVKEINDTIGKIQTLMRAVKAEAIDISEFNVLKQLVDKLASTAGRAGSRTNSLTIGSSLPRIESTPMTNSLAQPPGLLQSNALGAKVTRPAEKFSPIPQDHYGAHIVQPGIGGGGMGRVGIPPGFAPPGFAPPAMAAQRQQLEPGPQYDTYQSQQSRGSVDCPFRPGGELSGIISFLTRKYGSNICDKGVIEAIAAVVKEQSPDAAKNVCDLEAMTGYCSLNVPNQSLCYNFKEMRVVPTHYTLRSNWNGKPGGNNPRAWVIEGSLDGVSWIELDRRENNIDLDGKDQKKTYMCNCSPTCRYIRIRQTDKNHAGKDWLILSGFEIFGTLTLKP
jgi:hypothetical protein